MTNSQFDAAYLGQLGPTGPHSWQTHAYNREPNYDLGQYGHPTIHKSAMKTIVDDIKAFISEHRKIIYFIVILLLIDRFFLKRALENRIKAMAEKLLGTVEDKLHQLTTPAKPAGPTPGAPTP